MTSPKLPPSPEVTLSRLTASAKGLKESAIERGEEMTPYVAVVLESPAMLVTLLGIEHPVPAFMALRSLGAVTTVTAVSTVSDSWVTISPPDADPEEAEAIAARIQSGEKMPSQLFEEGHPWASEAMMATVWHRAELQPRMASIPYVADGRSVQWTDVQPAPVGAAVSGAIPDAMSNVLFTEVPAEIEAGLAAAAEDVDDAIGIMQRTALLLAIGQLSGSGPIGVAVEALHDDDHDVEQWVTALAQRMAEGGL